MNNLPNSLKTGLRWAVALLTPLVLLLTALRLLLLPVFVELEYRTPGFPEDPYGFTQTDRLHWAPIALEYLLNDAGLEFLGDLRFEDGEPVYNDRELAHMLDVKVLVQLALRVWAGLLLVLFGLGLWAWRTEALPLFVGFLAGGGRLTVLLMLALLLYLALNFNQLFVDFHSLFFEGDSWLFAYSDTLIRLFPIRFWRDSFLVLGALTLVGAGGLWWLGGRVVKPA